MSKEQMNVPRLRFPEFTDLWGEKKLGEICNRVTRKNKNGESELPLTISSQDGLVDQRTFFNKVVAAKDMTNYYLLKRGEFAYNKSYSKGFDYGSIKRLNAYDQGCLSTLYICFGLTDDDVDSDYLEQFFDTLLWYKDISQICAEGARNHGLLNVDTKAFFDCVTIKMPKSITEQSKIASFIGEYDTLISLQQRKLDQIKEYKKGILQKMFPKAGESIPEVRFPGFTGEWEQRKLSEIGEIITGTTPSTKDKDNYGGKKLFVSPADIQGNRYVEKTITTLTDKGYALGRELRIGTSLFVSIGSTIGKVAQIKDSATTNQQINAVVPNNEMDDNYVFTLLENKADSIKKLSAQQAVPIINKTTFGDTEISYPMKKEQIKIGKYFLGLDTLITLHQRKLDAMKEYKKGLLQQMFV